MTGTNENKVQAANGGKSSKPLPLAQDQPGWFMKTFLFSREPAAEGVFQNGCHGRTLLACQFVAPLICKVVLSIYYILNNLQLPINACSHRQCNLRL